MRSIAHFFGTNVGGGPIPAFPGTSVAARAGIAPRHEGVHAGAPLRTGLAGHSSLDMGFIRRFSDSPARLKRPPSPCPPTGRRERP
jgi:hypothetical protein